MSTWSLHTLTLLNAGQIAPLMAEPFADVLVPSLLNISGAVEVEDQAIAGDFRAVIEGGILAPVVDPQVQGGFFSPTIKEAKDALTALSLRVQSLPPKPLQRIIHTLLRNSSDEAPIEVSQLVDLLVRGGVDAGAIGGAAEHQGTELLFRRAQAMSEVVQGGFGELDQPENGNILDRAIEELLGLELLGTSFSAEKIAQIAKELVQVVSDNLDKLFSCLTEQQKAGIKRVAERDNIDMAVAQIEYLANLCLFKVLRDYYDLQKATTLPMGTRNGFIVLTENGSLVGSPPHDSSKDRTFHYVRMPSRAIKIQTGILTGRLKSDISVGSRFRSNGLNTSAVLEIVLIPPNGADIFRATLTMASQGMSEISVIVAPLTRENP